MEGNWTYNDPMTAYDKMRYNQEISRQCEEHHLRRCAEDPIYKRVYEKHKRMEESLQKEMVKVVNAMNHCFQKKEDGTANTKEESQPSERVTEIKLPECLSISGIKEDLKKNPLAWFFVPMFFMSEKQLQELKEEIPYEKEYFETEKRYDAMKKVFSPWEI
jgi:hypothetical protein